MKYKVCLLAGLTVVSAPAVFLLRPIGQPPVFHHFADGRVLLGVANGANVLSNLLFLIVGGVGLAGLGSYADDGGIYDVIVGSGG